MINHIKSKWSKLSQKEYKTRHDWMGKRLCKKWKFDLTNQLYMHNPESVLENKTHKLLGVFEIQTDHIFSARRQDQVINEKKIELAEL